MGEAERSKFERFALLSGLLTEQQLDAAKSGRRWSAGEEAEAEDAPPTDKQLAERLVELGWINYWQSTQLLDGRTKFNLGPYWIVDSIGQGGMGQVFKAEHSVMGRVVAIKVLPLAKSTPEAVSNFMREIRVLASLNHGNLVRALDYGQDGNVHFLVTEYVPGCDLRKLVRRGDVLDMQGASNIMYQVAAGLDHAHQNGLIHRDVKPGNVLVSPDGLAKLSDLGLAGPVDGDAESDPRYGKIVGTADYLPPDHVEAPWDPTPAWDIYSLGCTLYYAVTGKVPFPGGNTADKARAHCKLSPLDPRRLNKNLSDDFVDMLADMMAKDPAQRIPSAVGVMERVLPWADLSQIAPPIIESPPSPLQLKSNAIGTSAPSAADGQTQGPPVLATPPGVSDNRTAPPVIPIASPPPQQAGALPQLAMPPSPPVAQTSAPLAMPPSGTEMPSLSASNVYTRDTIADLPLSGEVEEDLAEEDDSASMEVETSDLEPMRTGVAEEEKQSSPVFPPLLLVLAPLMLVTAVMVILLVVKSYL